MKSGSNTLEQERSRLLQEKTALQQEGQALKAEKESFERARQEATAAFSAKADAHAKRVDELQGLMAKAETGAGGALVAEVAYRPDYVSAQAKLKSANAAWERNRCASANQSVDPAFARPSPGMEPAAGRSKSRLY